MGRVKKNATDSSCLKCRQKDTERMVQCDTCDLWFHYECVDVDDSIASADWKCDGCSAAEKHTNSKETVGMVPNKEAEDKPSVHAANNEFQSSNGEVIGMRHYTESDHNEGKFVSSNASVSSSAKAKRKMQLELMRLEEERKSNLAYLKQKYAIIQRYEEENDSDFECDDGKGGGGSDNCKNGDLAVRNLVLGERRNSENVENRVGNCVRDVQSAPSVSKGVPPPTTASLLNIQQINARHVIPKDLPTFSGKSDEWPLFITNFENSTKLCGFSNDENLLRLQRALKGKALEYVSSKLMIPELVPEVISTLRMMFGRPEQIIRNLVSKVRASPHVNANKLETLVCFSLEIKNLAATMQAAGLQSHLNNPMLIEEMLDKLPAQTRLEWALYARSLPDINLTVFSNWLFTLAEAASSIVTLPVANIAAPDPERRKAARVNFHENYNNTIPRCFICNEIHKIENCDKFKKFNYQERWAEVNDKRLCRTCLKKHNAKFCKNRKECGSYGCTRKHHPLLHKPVTNTSEIISTDVVAAHHMQTTEVLYRIVPVTIYGTNCSVDEFAFLDEGSSPTLIEKSVLDKLNMKGTASDLCLRWTDGTLRVEKNSEQLNLQLSAQGINQKKHTLFNVRSVSRLDLPSQTLIYSELTNKYNHLKGLPIKSYKNVVPRLIIGVGNRSVAMPLKCREGKPTEPAATKTRIGWTVYGQLGDSTSEKPSIIGANLQLHVCECDDDVALQKLMMQSMQVENVSSENLRNLKLNKAEEIRLRECVIRTGERFITKLLWKSLDLEMPDNYSMALRRLHCFERRLEKEPELKIQVMNKIKEMQDKGYIRKLCPTEVTAPHPRKWYLPIFAVKNPNKPQKTRIVWDAAAEFNRVSLNKCLDKGPDLLISLISVLFNFRVGKIAVCVDICEMFHRIFVSKEDTHSQRFLWRNGDTTRKPDVYALQVLSFGASCSPSLAQYVKNRNAKEHEVEFPRASKSIIERHYVDDMLDSVNSVQEAIQLACDVREVHKRGNFQIRNWSSNSAEVMAALGEVDRGNTFCRAGKAVENIVEPEKVLGLWWKTVKDTFTFNLKYTKATNDILRGKTLPTKREVLRLLMSIYDPLGLISFYTVHVKVLLQEIWRKGVSWDESIPAELAHSWTRWIATLTNIHDVEIPRCYFGLANSDTSRVQLHIFVDASEVAYAAVAYFRIESENGVETALICSKTRVAPLRPISIPRMELCAAVLGARLAATVQKGHEIKIQSTFYWTDSKTVLLWLRSDPRRYKQFVMFRIGELQESTDVTSWHFVPSKQNVADLATKWISQSLCNPESPWFTGPSFLRQPLNTFLNDDVSNITREEPRDPELRDGQYVATQVAQQWPLLECERFSRWERLLRCMAYVKRFITLLKSATKHKFPKINMNFKQISNLTQEELLWSQKFLYRHAQSHSFANEIKLLQRDATLPMPKSSPLRKLSPFIDTDNIIRLRGRLENAPIIDDATKNPVILPKDHYITLLIVELYHRKFKHINHETVLNELFQKYHIPSLRKLLRTVRSHCKICMIRTSQPRIPEMGSLPQGRLAAYTKPFSHVGVDFFGPFSVTIGRRTEKRYGTLFTCLTSRAVHIEVAHSLSMNSCVMVIRNFIARRGQPVQFYSDNGTNLVATEKELRESYKQINFAHLQGEFTSPETKWTFIPPASPHMGGAWERLVRSVKTVLYQVITPSTKLTDEKLNNLFLEIESILNSRPLTYLSLDTAEQEALTPNHFLLGSSSGHKTPGVFDANDKYTQRSWRHSQLLADQFWKRWLVEFLPTMTRRTNWFTKAKPIEKGDIVIIVDPNSPRHCWPKGIVTDVITGKDNQVRSARVRTANGEYHRPAAKIAVLDVNPRTIDSVVHA